MNNFLKKVFLNKISCRFLLPILIGLHNLFYQLISTMVVILTDGIHPKHQIMNYHQFFLDHIKAGETVIDIGCGNGYLARDIASKAGKVVGIDIFRENIIIANEKYNRSNLEFVVGDATTYHFSGQFDKIILSNVLEHINHRVNFLRKLHSLSKIILLRVPLLTRDWLTVYKYQRNFAYKLDKTHYLEYTMDDLNQELTATNWRLESYSIQFGEVWGVAVAEDY